MIKTIRMIAMVSLVLLMVGCTSRVSEAISRYHMVAPRVELGQSKEQVLAILAPTQAELLTAERKEPERFIKDGVTVEIYYFRSLNQYDGLLTDDEFTPYVFHDGILVAIGWQTLGGPKSQGQVKPEPPTIILHGGWGYYD